MIYIHSLWLRNENYQYLINNFHLYLLSALLIKKHGYRIELYCDKTTYNFYKIIPYDKINIIDYTEDGISDNFWVWSKIKPQLLINEPYVHIDADVFLFKDIIGDKLLNGEFSAIVQSTENKKTIGEGYNRCYIDAINPFKKYDKYNIDWEKYKMQSYNCGVIGFSDMEVKNEYCNLVKKLLYELSNDKTFKFNSYIHFGAHIMSEQTLLYYILNEKKIKTYQLIKHDDSKETDYIWKSEIPENIGYCHMWSNSKYQYGIKNKIINKIKNLFPESIHILNEFNNIKNNLKF